MNAHDPPGAERPRLRAYRLRLSVPDPDASRARRSGSARLLGHRRGGDDPALPRRARRCSSQGRSCSPSTTPCFPSCCTPAGRSGCAVMKPSKSLRDRVAGGHLRRARRHGGVRGHVAHAPGLRRPSLDPRRRRHRGFSRPTAGAGSGWTSSGATFRSARFPSTCGTPSSPSRTTGSTRIRASIPSRSGAPSSGTSASQARSQGGSTLTQQLARTLFLSNKKTYGRKVREAVLALMIDAQLTKEQVLELYLNRIYLSAGVYGVETMSRHLFGRPAKQLNLAECALIAGLARAPSALSPWSNLDGAIERSHVVLTRMREEGFITESEEREARRTSIRIRPYPGRKRSAGRLREGVSCASSSASGSAATIRPTGRCARPSSRSCRTRPSRSCASGLAPVQRSGAAGGARRDRSAHRRHSGARGRARFRAVAVQPREPQPASAGLGLQAAALRGRAREWILARVAHRRADDHRAARARRVGAEERRRRHAGRADAAGGAPRVEQSCGDRAAAAGRLAPGAAPRLARRASRHARRAVACRSALAS